MDKRDASIDRQTGNNFYGAGGFGAIGAFFANYVNFTGRSTRREFWWWQLWVGLFSLIFGGVAIAAIGGFAVHKSLGSLLASMIGFVLVYLLFAVIVALPSIAIAVRRFRDAGVHWGVYVALQVVATATQFIWAKGSTTGVVIAGVIGLITFVIEVLPTKNPPVAPDDWEA